MTVWDSNKDLYHNNTCVIRNRQAKLPVAFIPFLVYWLWRLIFDIGLGLLHLTYLTGVLRLLIFSFASVCCILSPPTENTGPEMLPLLSHLIWWLCDATLCQHVTYLHYLCLVASAAHTNWFSSAALLLLVLLAQVCLSWPIRADWVFRRRDLKRQELKQCFRQRGNTSLENMRKLKPFLLVTQNTMINLKMKIWHVSFISWHLLKDKNVYIYIKIDCFELKMTFNRNIALQIKSCLSW